MYCDVFVDVVEVGVEVVDVVYLDVDFYFGGVGVV